MDSKRCRILILDANQRSGLAVTRSLGKAFPGYSIATADSTVTALAGQSKYSKQYLRYPDPLNQASQFINWVKAHVCNRFDLVLPTTEVTSQLLLYKRAELPGLPMAFPDIDTVLKLADKGRLVKTAEQAGIPVPKTRHYSSIAELDRRALNFPVVLKPCRSKILTDQGWVSTTVRILKNEESLDRYLTSDHYLKEHPFMIQEFISGHGAGVFCLYNKGEPVQYFAHRRLREKPPEGGVSVLSQATKVNPSLQHYSEALLRTVNWHGVAMVEFRISDDGQPYLMEVNTRFWGSLQLAVDSGVDFPAQLVRLHFGDQPMPVTHYNTQQRLRWLLGDLDSLYIFLKQPNSWASKIRRAMSFCLPRLHNQKHEVNRLSDLGPFLEELKQYLKPETK